jgi:hypothetical protein
MDVKGQVLELFFIDGAPDGMLTAQIVNWTGHVLMTPRTQLGEALKRPEASRPGAYILLGESEQSNQPRAYIGESEDVGERIRTHDIKLDWWTQVVLVTSAANWLNKALVKYLESRLVEEARRVGWLSLQNGNTPPRPSLSEASMANIEQFFEHVLSILPAIRVDGFLVKTRQAPASSPATQSKAMNAPTLFELKQVGVNGTAKLQDGEFIVQPGSLGRKEWIGQEHNYKKLFEEVVKSGVYVPEGDHRVFKQAYAFSSPSAAGAILNGRSTAGPLAWKLASDNSKTYRQWEEEQLGGTSDQLGVLGDG